MNNWLLALIFGACVSAPLPRLHAAESSDEGRLIQILQSNASLTEKDAACAQLKIVGTSRCVPALAALLADEQLSHSARYALEPMQSAEAGRALVEALGRTKGGLRVGIINSVAAREESFAIPALIPLLRNADVQEASAAAYALGRIGGADALKALRSAARNSTGPLHSAEVDGLLTCADRMLRSSETSGNALAAFEQLDSTAESDRVRIAAFRGRVRASGNASLRLLLQALAGPDGPQQVAAIQLVHELPDPKTSQEVSQMLQQLSPNVQVALIAALAQRRDISVVPALTRLAGGGGPEVQLAIIGALDTLGDASSVGLLSSFAANGATPLQKAARQSLVDLHRGNITEALLQQLGTATPQVQAEAARALGARGDNTAVAKLLEVANNGNPSARKAALSALSLLADNSQLGALVELVVQAKDPASQAEATEALNAAYQRIQTQNGNPDVEPLVQSVEKANPAARAALLSVCGGINDPKVRSALRKALQDPDAQVYSSAAHALSDTTDIELLPDLLQLARSGRQDSARALAIDGGVRLVTQEETVKLSPAERVAALKSLLSAAGQTDQRRRVLAGLGEVPEMESLKLIESEIADPNVCNEAARALIKILPGLPGNQSETSEAALNKAIAAATDPATRQALEAARKQIQVASEYLTTWEIAGPYRQAQKDYAALFDIAFAPERQGGGEAKWTALPASSDPKRPYVMDLFKALGGQDCVAYARTWLRSDRDQDALLEFGSDDGIKMWLNEKQVYSLNVARPLQPGSDKVKVALHAGWNPLLVKITQNNQGWEFCVRVRTPDGSHIQGVRCDSAPQTASAKP
jgi:HEAT repeat protein